ncbi:MULTISPECIES: hypothetical protein [Eikenella]|uniref:Uncharacterized protein n=1 Tax=Eikenella longinqua TaxID=1795827 RepID=A0A1A9RZK1_9NEIS|nr:MULTISPECIES: hypothetical protein [Eikenella]OAM30034.1 hypothetical protein A7P95_03165 [Eikenella longinqua]
MSADELARNFYLEKLKFLSSCFEEQPAHPSAVNAKIKALLLNDAQAAQLKEVIDMLLDDVFYTILLGLDGECAIGSVQQTYKIYDEQSRLISDCGELEVSAGKYFNERKYEKEMDESRE